MSDNLLEASLRKMNEILYKETVALEQAQRGQFAKNVLDEENTRKAVAIMKGLAYNYRLTLDAHAKFDPSKVAETVIDQFKHDGAWMAEQAERLERAAAAGVCPHCKKSLVTE